MIIRYCTEVEIETTKSIEEIEKMDESEINEELLNPKSKILSASMWIKDEDGNQLMDCFDMVESYKNLKETMNEEA